MNKVGQGEAYYIASRNDERFHDDLYNTLIDRLGLKRALGRNLPEGVTAHVRHAGDREIVFLLGFNRRPVKVDQGAAAYRDRIGGKRVTGKMSFPAYTAMILDRLPAAGKKPTAPWGRRKASQEKGGMSLKTYRASRKI
ncbi:MAG: hypothetical protein ABIF71_08995 [Planctomycetota bacterium]